MIYEVSELINSSCEHPFIRCVNRHDVIIAIKKVVFYNDDVDFHLNHTRGHIETKYNFKLLINLNINLKAFILFSVANPSSFPPPFLICLVQRKYFCRAPSIAFLACKATLRMQLAPGSNSLYGDDQPDYGGREQNYL